MVDQEYQTIIVTGSVMEGLEFIGPFETRADAFDYARSDPNLSKVSWWLASLHTPAR